MTTKKIHYNKPQLRSMAVDAPTEYLIAGRGTGKTVGVLARKSAQRYLDGMPRGSGVILAATYTQALTRTIPELIRGWEMHGYRKDYHFLIGQRPSEKWKRMWKWEAPFAPPLDYKYIVTWWNGAVARIISQERAGSSNGISIDWIIGDELKLINHEKLTTELLPANRGIIEAFKGNIYHHGQTYTTDMPVGTAGRWIFDIENAMDKEKVNYILQLQQVRYKLFHSGKDYSAQINVIDEEIQEARQNLLYYHTASTLDNIHALGEEYILNQIRDTSIFQFDTQILNIKPDRLEDGFYPDFDEEVHGYFSENENYFDNLNTDVFDCRKDGDLNPELPLHISLDYNRRIFPVSVGQFIRGKEVRSLKALHVLYPGKVRDAVQEFCDYYRFHKNRIVYYWYDQTAVGDMYDTRLCDDVIDVLVKNKWNVQPKYLGPVPGHEERYRMWGNLLTRSGKYKEQYTINRENCRYLILSKNQAEAEQTKLGFGKSKKTERDPNFPAEESTHYSDAEDTWVFGVLESGQDLSVHGGRGSIIL